MVLRTVPTFVLAANALTDPNDFCETLLVWKNGSSLDGCGYLAMILAMFYFIRIGWFPSASSSKDSNVASTVLARFFMFGAAMVFMIYWRAALPISLTSSFMPDNTG